MGDPDTFFVGRNNRRNLLPLIQDPESGWYKPWYFDLRFHEEYDRSRRYGVPMSLICVQLRRPDAGTAVRDRLAAAGKSLLRSTDLRSQLDDVNFALCLPHTDEAGAAVVMERLVRLLSDFEPLVGRATFPADGDDAEMLLGRAFNRALYGRV